jgi:hypothetical protein
VVIQEETQKMNKRLAIGATLLILVFLLPAAQTPKENVLGFIPDQVVLKGIILYRLYYGPPNYGENPETDRKEWYYLIKLDSPVTVIAKPDDLENETTTDIELVQIFEMRKLSLKKYIGKRVKLAGTLHTALIGHEHTKVIINASTIEPIKRSHRTT